MSEVSVSRVVGLPVDGVEFDQVEAGLFAVLDLGAEGAVGHPVDAGEVYVGVVAELHPDGIASLDGDDGQPDAGVLHAGEGVAVVFLGGWAGLVFALVHDAIDRDVGFVHLLEGDVAAVLGPPQPGEAVHLFLGYVLGEAVSLARASRAGCYLGGVSAFY